MERLTHERVNGIKTGYWSAATKEVLVQKLAAYENTGYEPDEIRAAIEQAAKNSETKTATIMAECIAGAMKDTLEKYGTAGSGKSGRSAPSSRWSSPRASSCCAWIPTRGSASSRLTAASGSSRPRRTSPTTS